MFEALQERPELLGGIESNSLVLDPSAGSAKTLAPAIEKLLVQLEMSPKDLHAIAVVQGPGSFTGLRVGIATAKALAYALGIPVVAVDTLDVIANQVASMPARPRRIELIATVDAFRGQCFWSRYFIDGKQCVKVHPTAIDDNEVLAGEIQRVQTELTSTCTDAQDSVVWVAGPSMRKLQEGSSGFALDRIEWIPCDPISESVSLLGWTAWLRGQTVDVFGLLPTYYRSSAAEEKQSRGEAS